MKERYILAKTAKVGDKICCAYCHKEFIKKQYSQAFCCKRCKDKFHNIIDGDRHSAEYKKAERERVNTKSRHDKHIRHSILVEKYRGMTPAEIDEEKRKDFEENERRLAFINDAYIEREYDGQDEYDDFPYDDEFEED